jgi:hypothetical protein
MKRCGRQSLTASEWIDNIPAKKHVSMGLVSETPTGPSIRMGNRLKALVDYEFVTFKKSGQRFYSYDGAKWDNLVPNLV